MTLEFITVLTICKEIIGNFGQIRSFIDDGEMTRVLQEIGDVLYNAAIRALEDARESSEPSREIESAINSLREACEAFIRQATERMWLGLRGPSEAARAEGYWKSCETSVLIALCYRYLGDKALANGYLKDAKAQFESYAEAEMENVEYIRNLALYGDVIIGTDGLRESTEKMLKEERKVLLSLSKDV
jgi:hypothetical protein